MDASGLRMLVTSQLRQFDAGVLTLGHNVSPTMVVPPGVSWTTSGQCSGQCTKKVGFLFSINIQTQSISMIFLLRLTDYMTDNLTPKLLLHLHFLL